MSFTWGPLLSGGPLLQAGGGVSTGSHYQRLLHLWRSENTMFVQSEATAARRRLPLYLVDATDGITPETGEAGGQPQISKNGGAWANTTATLTAVGNGKYYVELTAAELSDTGKIGWRYKSANTAEFSLDADVQAMNVHDSVRAGLTALPNAAANAANGLLTFGTGAGQLNPDTGRIGPNWANVGNPTTTVGLSGTTLKPATYGESYVQYITGGGAGLRPYHTLVVVAKLQTGLTAVPGTAETGAFTFQYHLPLTGATGISPEPADRDFEDFAALLNYNATNVTELLLADGVTSSGFYQFVLQWQADGVTLDPFTSVGLGTLRISHASLTDPLFVNWRLDKVNNAEFDTSFANSLDGRLGAIDDAAAAISAKTTNLPSDPADASVVAGLIAGLATTLATIAGYIDTEVASIKTTVEALPSAATNASTLLATAIEGIETVADQLRLAASGVAGAMTGLPSSLSGTIAIKSKDGSKTRIGGTVAGGTRTVTTRDGT